MKRVIKSTTEDILCMSSISGKYVKNPNALPFSFYFSSGSGVTHSIRVKPMFNPEKLISSLTGTLKLCDDWEYIPGRNDSHVSKQDIDQMKKFFKDHIVLFCAVWDEQLQDGVLEDYLKGTISFSEMIEDLNFYENYPEELKSIKSIPELEDFCCQNDLVNFYGN